MNWTELLPFAMFAVLLAFILLGFPVAFTLAGTALLFALIGVAADIFIWDDLGFLPAKIWGIIENYTLVAVPLFIFMGLLLERSGIAEDLLTSLSYCFRRLRGSLAITVVLVGALLAASTGIAGATVVTISVIALPTMLRHGYDKSLAAGTVAASGTLGQIIPPSIVLVLLGDIMNVNIGSLFVGAIIPGVILVASYLFYVTLRSYFSPTAAPAAAIDTADNQRSLRTLLSAILPPFFLMLVVLGSIIGGLASPTEAAGCGAFAALVITCLRRGLHRHLISEAAQKTAVITAMVFTLLIGAQFFAVVFRGLHGDVLIEQIVLGSSLSPIYVLLGVMLLMFVLGFFLDFLEICFIIIPVVFPLLRGLGFDPLWLAVIMALNLQTSFLTPPFGFALFYLKGSAPPEFSTADIYRGAVPFVALQILVIAIIMIFPFLVLWLPRYLL